MKHILDDGHELIGVPGADEFTEEQRYAFFEYVQSERFRSIRDRRNKLLAETDYLALSDQPPMPEEMKAYRQALRDITKSATPDGQVDWPVKP